MTRYIVLPTVLVFALGLGAGWALRGGRSKPRDVWDDAAWWSKGFEDGLKIRRLTRDDVAKPVGQFQGYCVRDDRYEPATATSEAVWVAWLAPDWFGAVDGVLVAGSVEAADAVLSRIVWTSPPCWMKADGTLVEIPEASR